MNKRECIIFIIILLFTIVMCFPYLTMHYSTDTYTIIGDGYEHYAINTFLNAGRIFSSFITWGAGCFHVPINLFVQMSFFIGIVISCICVMEIRKTILYIKPELSTVKEIMILGISYSIIFQFMYLENMYFVEIPVMAVGILLFIKSAQYIVNEKYAKSMVYLLIGELCYQGTINFFITFTFVLLMIHNKKFNKDIIKKMLYACLFCILAVTINLLQIKICGNILHMEQTRMGSILKIPSNIIYIIKHIGIILVQSSDLLPDYVFLIFLNIILVLIGINQVKPKDEKAFIPIILITIVAILASVGINIISSSSFGLGRMVFSVGALIGLIFMYIYCSTNILEDNSIMKYTLLIVFTLYFIINGLNYTTLMYKNKQANQLDKIEAEKVDKYISQYEKENNTKIKKIAVAYDKDITWYHKQLKQESLFTHRGLMIWWCNVQAINYYTNRNLERVNMSRQKYNTYFEGKNWDQLDEEQFVFEGDTLYYCVY